MTRAQLDLLLKYINIKASLATIHLNDVRQREPLNDELVAIIEQLEESTEE